MAGLAHPNISSVKLGSKSAIDSLDRQWADPERLKSVFD